MEDITLELLEFQEEYTKTVTHLQLQLDNVYGQIQRLVNEEVAKQLHTKNEEIKELQSFIKSRNI